jgi:1-deoxy-D-xylulose-5-phosphate reductoisomerase
MKKRIAVLGATGSIGKSTLDVIRAARDDFEPVLFSAHRDAAGLLALAGEFPGAFIALAGGAERGEDAALAASVDKKRLFSGREGLLRAIASCDADMAVNGIAGAAGLEPSLAVLESGANLALANKESVVMAWRLVSDKAKEHGAGIIPVDSEHSAVFSLINAHGEPAEIILTASGGPFRTFNLEELRAVTVEKALTHPTWNMGRKITIDSASLANKGLEVIEAVRLFNVRPAQVKVVVHPQSIVHSMIRLADGALYAELSKPDMRLPIHKALYHPEIRPCPFARLDLNAPSAAPLALGFEQPDSGRFPMLRLAYQAVCGGELCTVVYNAANEAAVDRFINGHIGFLDIPRITEKVLSLDWSGEAGSIECVLETDRRAREAAQRA